MVEKSKVGAKNMIKMQSIEEKFYKSFGAMTVTMSFLFHIEQLRLQHLNKWMYERGVKRVQVRFKIFRVFYFADFQGYHPFKKAIQAYSFRGVVKITPEYPCNTHADSKWPSCQIGRYQLFMLKSSAKTYKVIEISPARKKYFIVRQG